MNDKIMVVDDESEIADLVEVYLQNENYIVNKFYTAKDDETDKITGLTCGATGDNKSETLHIDDAFTIYRRI